jgi:DNA-binding NarL/FixJ family response regulator
LKLRVLVATDQLGIRKIVEDASEAIADLVLEFVTDRKSLERRLAVEGAEVDAVLLDAGLPSLSSGDALPLFIEKLVPRRIAVLVARETGQGYARRLALAGASGIFPKDTSPETLGHALKAISNENTIWIGRIDPLPRTDRRDRLSERELQVLVGICDGLQNKEIAHGFDIQEVTVKMHVRSIIRKLGAKNRTHAAMIAMDRGLIG